MIIDAWVQHPNRPFLESDMFASLRRWTGGQIPEGDLPIEMTIDSMDAAGVDFALLTAWRGPRGDLISNDQVAEWVRRHPGRFAGMAAVDLDRPMEAVRELRRRVRDDGFAGLRMLPWLWGAPPTDRRYYPLYAECVELGVPFCTQVGHTGPLMPSETGRPIPYIDQIAIDFPDRAKPDFAFRIRNVAACVGVGPFRIHTNGLQATAEGPAPPHSRSSCPSNITPMPPTTIWAVLSVSSVMLPVMVRPSMPDSTKHTLSPRASPTPRCWPASTTMPLPWQTKV